MYVCMCVYVCMYVCTYVRMHVCMYVYIYIYTHICVLPKHILSVKVGFQSCSLHTFLMAETEMQKSGIG